MENKIKKGIVFIKPCAQNPNYLVDEEGMVYSKRFPDKPLAIHKSNRDYYRVSLYNSEKKKIEQVSVHRAVAMTFLSDSYQEGYVVNHIDGDKSNNRVDNLQWVTEEENNLHADKVLGKIFRGGDNPNATPIQAIDPCTGEVVMEFGSIAEAALHVVGSDDFILNRRVKNSLSAAKKSGNIWRGYIWRGKEK